MKRIDQQWSIRLTLRAHWQRSGVRPFSRCWLRGLIFLLAIAGTLATPVPAAGEAEKTPSLEYQVKAVFLLNFTKFIDWPPMPSAEAPFTICILGDDPFGTTLERIVEGETVQGRRLVLQRLGREEPRSCQMLFAGQAEKNLARYLARLGPGVLTVGEGENFLGDGGMIAFVIDNRRVRFDINLRAANKATLKISSKLLNVARLVER